MRALHAVQVNGFLDPLRRDPEALLEAWPTLLDTAAAAVEAGARVTVLQAAARGGELERRGVHFRFVEGSGGRRERNDASSGPGRAASRLAAGFLARRLAHLAGSLHPDVVHLHGLGFPLHARLLALRCGGAPLVVQDHGDRVPSPWRLPLHRPLHRWGLARAAAVAFTAREQADPFVRAGILPAHLRVMELLESSSRFTPGDREAARAATGLTGEPCVLWVGRLDRNKDPLTALDAVAHAARDLPGIHLWCCFTDAPLLARVERRIAADPLLSGRVRLLGRVPHGRVQDLCRAADIFLSSSRHEGSGYAMLEALACGLPPVATDIPSFRRLTGGGRAGALAPVGDAEGLGRALVHLARTVAGVGDEGRGKPGERVRGDRSRARRAVRAHFEAELSFDALGRELCAGYEALRADGRGVAGRALGRASERASGRACDPPGADVGGAS